MIDTNRYAKAMAALIKTPYAEMSAAQHALVSAAEEVDDLTRRVVEDCRLMADRFERYAREVDQGYCYGNVPSTSQTVNDISMSTARLEVKRADILSLIGAVMGRESRVKFVELLNPEP